MNVVLEHAERLPRDQSWDLHWRFHNPCLSEREYMGMVMFQMLVGLLQAQSRVSCVFDLDKIDGSLGEIFSSTGRLHEPQVVGLHRAKEVL